MEMAKTNDNLIEVNHLSVTFYNGKDENHAVEDVTFRIKKGEVLGVVGESGSGKSVSAMSIMRLISYPPGKITGGEIIFEGEDVLKKTEEEMMKIRGNKISMIFQEPMTSFNPLYTIGSQIVEAIVLHQDKPKKEAEQMAVELLHEVGISFPEKRVKEYPHQMSGGMLQRAMIAMAPFMQSAAAYSRRAYYRFGCYHSGADTGSDQKIAGRTADVHNDDHSRSWSNCGSREICGRYVCRESGGRSVGKKSV